VDRNKLAANTTIPCLTYIRDPVKRLVSYYYWYVGLLHDESTSWAWGLLHYF
jgi:hypothetical protein